MPPKFKPLANQNAPDGGGVRKPPPRRVKQKRFVVSPILLCDLETLLKGRPDEQRLRAHLLRVKGHGKKFRARREAAQAKLKKGDASEKHAIPSYKAKETEAIGEEAATKLMIQKYVAANADGDYHLLWGFSAGTGIDQLWYANPPDTFVIVEAKGPGAGLATNAAKGPQMSKEWVWNTLEEVKTSPKASPKDIDDANRMQKAMRTGPLPRVIGRVIEADGKGGAVERGCPDKGTYHAT